MRFPEIQGLIRRRILVNFRADPAIVSALLPGPFVPKTVNGCAMVGICLIRLEQMGPLWLPTVFGLSSENAAHRIAVCWADQEGRQCEGVYIPRRDTSSLLNNLVGGRLFPGEHHRAHFDVLDNGEVIDLQCCALDYSMRIDLRVQRAGALPASSVFATLEEASDFFRQSSLGYSETAAGKHLDGVVLQTKKWEVEPYDMERIESSYFSNQTLFPRGSIEFDNVLVMRNIEHCWLGAPNLTKQRCRECV